MLNNLNFKTEEFFLVVALGLEERAENELIDWCAVLATEFGAMAYLQKIEVVKGGIEFEIGEPVGLLLNRCLKLPSRILQRIHSFTTREWPVVEKELNKVQWKKYFTLGIKDWEIAASESRMNNEKHLLNLLEEKFANKTYLKSAEGTVAYLRVYDNLFTLSRDTSGEHLHFRGYRQNQGLAPLRENFASFVWSLLIKERSRIDAGNVLIIDPFVGAGTLLFEALLWNQIFDGRQFVGDIWISPEIEAKFQNVRKRLTSWNLNLVGVDIDPEMVKKSLDNLGNLKQFLKNKQVEFKVGSSTQTSRPEWLNTDREVWLISNPPYGGKGRIKGVESWRTLWEGALNCYNPTWAIALGPERDCKKGDIWSQWQCLDTHRFLNGGLRVAASVWKKINHH